MRTTAVPLPFLARAHAALLFLHPDRLLAHLAEMVRRAPAVTPVGCELLAEDEPVPVHVELARDVPERRARAVVPLPHAQPPVRALAVLGLARFLKRADALGHGAKVRRLRERRGVLGLERVEVRLERRVVREQVM